MAVSRAEWTRISNARIVARRNVISRTAKTWTRLYKTLTGELKEIAGKWLNKLLEQARRDISSGVIESSPDFPEKFTKALTARLREALAQGYWLNHLYVRELQTAYKGRKYRGKVTLSDLPDDERLKELLQDFISLNTSDEWYEIIPADAVNWLNNYIPTLAGGLSVDVLKGVQDVIRNSLIEGLTLQERMRALRESSEELARMTDSRIEAIARTEITRADTMGRLISMKANDDVIGVEFSAVMDDRTTEMCIERNGLIMRLDDPRLPENTPPLHVNCRSLLISLTIYDFPDGVLTSHEFDEIPSGMQRAEDIEEIRALLEDVSKGIQDKTSNTDIDIRAKVERLRQQDAEYQRQYYDLQTQMELAVSRRDVKEYDRLSEQQDNVFKLWRKASAQLRDIKIEAAEQGIIYASRISEKLPSEDIQAITKAVENASEPIRKVWNAFEDSMKIASTYESRAYYSPREKAVYFSIYEDRENGMRPQYNTLCHELGHLIDNSVGLGYCSQDWKYGLYDSLVSEVNDYVNNKLTELKSNALSMGLSPRAFKKADAYKAVEKEISTQLMFKSKMAVSDIFGGVTLNKVKDGWGHSTSYWKGDKDNICFEFFAQTFSDSITNPEAIEVTKKYFPKSYKIFEQIINDIGGKKS